MKVNDSAVYPKTLFALIVNDEFSPLRVFESKDIADAHRLQQVNRWRQADPTLADAWFHAQIIEYRRSYKIGYGT